MKRMNIKKIGTIDIDNAIHNVNLHSGLNIISGISGSGKSTILEIINFCFGESKGDKIPDTITKISKYHFVIYTTGEATYLIARNAKRNLQYIFSSIDRYQNDTILETIENTDICNWEEANEFIFSTLHSSIIKIYDYSKKVEKRITFRNCLSFCLQNDLLPAEKKYLFYRAENDIKKKSIIDELNILFNILDDEYYKNYSVTNSLKKEIARCDRIIASYDKDNSLRYIQNKIKTLFNLINFEYDISKITSLSDFRKSRYEINDDSFYQNTPLNLSNSKIINRDKTILRLEEEIDFYEEKEKKLQLQFNSYINIGDTIKRKRDQYSLDELMLKEIGDNDLLSLLLQERDKLNIELSKIVYSKNKHYNHAMRENNKIKEEKKMLLQQLRNEQKQDLEFNSKIKGTRKKMLYCQKLEVEIKERLKLHEKIKKDAILKKQELENELKNFDLPSIEEIMEKQDAFEDTVNLEINELFVPLSQYFEHNRKTISVDLFKKLSIYYKSIIDSNPIYLSSWGSDKNYTYAHIFAMLSLHSTFHFKKCNRIPAFITFDQLSRPFFPSKINNLSKDPDIITYKNLLLLISTFTNRTKNNVQVILVEHARGELMKEFETHYIKDDNGNNIIFDEHQKYINRLDVSDDNNI